MHTQPQTPNLPDGPLLGRTEVLRSGKPENPRHRLAKDADSSPVGQGKKDQARAALTETLERTASLLGQVQADRLAVPRQDTEQAVRRQDDSKGDEGGRQASGNRQTRVSACASPQLCNRTFGSRSGLVDDQQTPRPRQLHHHDGLPALSPGAPGHGAESAGLVADGPTANVPATGGKQLGKDRTKADPGQPRVINVLRWGAPQAVTLRWAPRVRDTLAKLTLCRTHHLGGRQFQCEDCHKDTSLYNSCGNRHCPQCSGGKRVDFHEKASKLILDDVVYYQVVFTLPAELSELATDNRMAFADLPSKTGWKCLCKQIKREQGYQPAAISVLHTWNQQLESHWHAHLLVPGAGPSLDGRRWVKATAPAESPNSDGFYLVDSERLKEDFRRQVIGNLRRLRRRGELVFQGKHEYLQSDENWEAFLKHLESKSWVAYIQAPPTAESVAVHVVNYLTRYLTGGPMSDHRLLSADLREVTFLARVGNRVGGERAQMPVTLSTKEFTERWCLHIQPDQLTKTRYYGGWSSSRLREYQRLCAVLRPPPAEPESDTESDLTVEALDEAPFSDIVCDHCGSERLVLVKTTEQPDWAKVLGYHSKSCPFWYDEIRAQDDEQFWDGAMGEGFNAWYLEYLIESAKETEGPTRPRPPTHRQPLLPGMTLPSGYLLNSF